MNGQVDSFITCLLGKAISSAKQGVYYTECEFNTERKLILGLF